MNKKLLLIGVLAILVIVGLVYWMVGLDNTQKVEEGVTGSLTYENTRLGFALDFPAEWEKRFVGVEEGNQVLFSLQDSPEGETIQSLFQIYATPLAEFAQLEEACDGVMDRDMRDQWMGDRVQTEEGQNLAPQCAQMDDSFLGKNSQFSFHSVLFLPSFDPLGNLPEASSEEVPPILGQRVEKIIESFRVK